MKSVLSLSLVLFASTLFARENTANLNKHNFAALSVNAAQVHLNIGYPGARISNVCGIRIRISGFGSSETLEKLAAELVVTEGFSDRLKPMTLKVEEGNLSARLPEQFITNQTYMALVNVSTRSGATLEKVIEDVLRDGETAIALPMLCK